ncbi:30S ribosomal protein S31, chloroplastic [Punica granatum]|uniref:Uncharacterized protein n=2 Tax=Punica granatum TaxID=22663 RepID=A0A2I0J5H4_PUNGR|nr:30S ribosomal protein S31, chloroplastic [Punica granatum]PKI51477.1 hypothetical protein CRG98_028188 [Punica granatum]
MASILLGAPSFASHPPSLCPRISFSHSQTLGTSLSSSASLSISSAASSPSVPLVYCGRGDKKTAKGKRFNHSFGNARPRNKKKGRGPPRVPTPPSPPKKDKFEDDEKVKIEIDESLFSG